MVDGRIPVTILSGGSAADRERALAQALAADAVGELPAALLEGLPDGEDRLRAFDQLQLSRISAGCICCAGRLVMKVHLDRLLRKRPSILYLGLARAEHEAELRDFLSRPPYDGLLNLP